ncbi:hypothetical protein ACFWG0_05410 [Streptomyces yangpuensis]|uniref:hypothetical protein n=1 Tax=Streptomyces yangpuensis TaxID=1648182 RepID=UPI003656D8AF
MMTNQAQAAPPRIGAIPSCSAGGPQGETTRQVGQGAADDARRIAAVFAAWRREVHGDHGTLALPTAEHEVVTRPW